MGCTGHTSSCDGDPVLATVEDYTDRFGVPSDDRVPVMLQDASTAVLNAYEARYGAYREGAHPRFDRAAAAVCCAIVNRALNSGSSYDGASGISQTAGAYSASLTFGTPQSSRPRLWPSDLKDLGLSGTMVGSIPPMCAPDRGSCPCSD